MEYRDLARIESLVQYPWDAVALFCLEDDCLRYSELYEGMEAWGARHLTESELTRTLHRLVRRGIVSVEPGAHGYNAYCITEAGRVRLGQIRSVLEAVPSLEPPGESDSRAAD
jgi:DNA-binding HxlR family transcriptional regulator